MKRWGEAWCWNAHNHERISVIFHHLAFFWWLVHCDVCATCCASCQFDHAPEFQGLFLTLSSIFAQFQRRSLRLMAKIHNAWTLLGECAGVVHIMWHCMGTLTSIKNILNDLVLCRATIASNACLHPTLHGVMQVHQCLVWDPIPLFKYSLLESGRCEI